MHGPQRVPDRSVRSPLSRGFAQAPSRSATRLFYTLARGSAKYGAMPKAVSGPLKQEDGKLIIRASSLDFR
jgi:hypothetical protein